MVTAKKGIMSSEINLKCFHSLPCVSGHKTSLIFAQVYLLLQK